VNGFYDGLASFVDHLVGTGFVRPAHAELLVRDADPDALIRRLRQA
jgi:predicted Rossmann-fold nucleotide-binding protein